MNISDYIYIIIPSATWIITQVIKYSISLRKDGFEWSDIIQSGGLPSAHSAFVTSLTVAICLTEGAKSVAFAVALVLMGLVIYDSMGVRRTTGEQTDAIMELSRKQKIKLNSVIHDSKGHELKEVVAGCLVGSLVAIVIWSMFKA